jgi:phage-related protein
MAKSTDLIVNIITDASKAGKGIDEATGKFGKFNDVMGKMVGPAAAVLGGITVLGTTALNAASDLQQAAGGVEAVFGDGAKQINDWAAAAATSVGLSSAAYSTFASQIGSQLKNLGVPLDQVAGKTDEMIRLGADLAATYGGTTEDAVSALGAAFRGEADSAEKYGLGLSVTAVNAELAAKGQDKLEGAALSAAKAQAVMDIATRQAGGAIGMFASESDTLAGQQQTLNAQLENTAAALGEQLLPIITPIVAALAEFAGWIQENSTLVSVIIGVIAALAAIVLVYAAAQWVANAAMFANPVGLVIAGIVLLIAAIAALVIWVMNNTEAIGQFFADMWSRIQDVTAAVASWFRSVWGAVAGWFRSVWAAVAAFFTGIWQSFTSAVNTVVSGIRAVVGVVATWFAAQWTKAVAVVSSIIRTLQGIFASVFGAIQGAINGVVGAFNAVVNAVKNVIGWISKIKIPNLGGLFGGGGKSAPMSFGMVPTVSGRALTAGPFGSVPAVTGVTAGTVINVYGGLDSGDAIARRIEQVLRERDRRNGGVTLGRRRR